MGRRAKPLPQGEDTKSRFFKNLKLGNSSALTWQISTNRKTNIANNITSTPKQSHITLCLPGRSDD